MENYKIVNDGTGKSAKQLDNGTLYSASTPDAVISQLEHARATHKRLRLFYGKNMVNPYRNGKVGEAWPEEFDVLGYVGRTCGIMKIPILINRNGSSGGHAISTDDIVAIKYGKHWLYRHKDFTTGKWEIEENHPNSPTHKYAVLHNGALHAAFDYKERAERYCAFMRGERNSK